MTASKPRAGDWVEVRSKEEILASLDGDGCLDGMPFMPEMFAFCGRKFQVYKRAHKTCDTVFPVRGRRVDRAVHLDTRCDGSAHGGCHAGCLLFWKEVWLKPAEGPAVAEPATGGCQESVVIARTEGPRGDAGERVYRCQATQLPYATSDLKWWQFGQYWEDYQSGNASLRELVNAGVYSLYFSISQSGIGLGPAMRSFYTRWHRVWGGTPFPRQRGKIPAGQPTPVVRLNLNPGELVRIKPLEKILETVDTDNKNRGMAWDAEEVPYCGGTYRVLRRVERLINERTGRMQEMKTPGVILDSVICLGRYSDSRVLCPRAIYPYWREAWLERVESERADR